MRRLAAIGLLLVALAARAEVPLPASVSAPEWRAVGSGSLNWLMLRVYDATLWRSAAGDALAIRYARDLSGRQLLDATFDEMTHLNVAGAARWRAALAEIFPDVRAGEVLVAVRHPAQGVRFFHQGRALGAIDAPAFGAAFFAIWLDPRTRAPALRSRLLGGVAP
ncbi:MAG: chalcone isomerase family protein [Rhodocyclaceae bacterium]|nr:chalcone isomerase family protein [Rhodocyclaceae bacterium]